MLDIINQRWESQLHSPLHGAAYYLNPHYHYSPDFRAKTANAKIKFDLYNSLGRMIPDDEEKVKIDLQMDRFKYAKGLFGFSTAVMTRTKKSPGQINSVSWLKVFSDISVVSCLTILNLL